MTRTNRDLIYDEGYASGATGQPLTAVPDKVRQLNMDSLTHRSIWEMGWRAGRKLYDKTQAIAQKTAQATGSW